MEKPCLLLDSMQKRKHKCATSFYALMQHFPLVKLEERKRKHILLEDITNVKNSFYR
jgi:hypothetical protein